MKKKINKQRKKREVGVSSFNVILALKNKKKTLFMLGKFINNNNNNRKVRMRRKNNNNDINI